MSVTGRRAARGIRPYLSAAMVGIALTYATAWVGALWSPYTRSVPPPLFEEHVGVGHSSDHALGFRARTTLVSRGFSEMGYWEFKEWAHSVGGTYTAGWPAPALVSEVCAHHAEPSGPALGGFDLPAGVLLARGVPTDRLPAFVRAEPRRRVPFTPLWPGFAVNTAVYSALTLVVAGVVGTTRRRLAGRAGRCPGCGYDRAGLGGRACPECGLR